MTDVLPDEIQPDGSEASDPGSTAPIDAATLEEAPTAAVAADPAMPPVSDAPAAGTPEPMAATPVSTPAPEPALTSSDSPSLEMSTTVPAADGRASNPHDHGDSEGEGGGGGEWDLLLSKVQAWLGSGELQTLWNQARRPLNLLLTAVAVVLMLRVYGGLISAIDSLPLVPGLLELVGLIWAVRCGLPRLLQSNEREQLISGLQQRWRSFTGRG